MKNFKYDRLSKHYKLIIAANRVSFLFFLSLMFVSCRTTKTLQQSEQQLDNIKNIEKNAISNLDSNLNITNKINTLSFGNQKKEYLILRANINIKFPQITQAISATIELASTDSVLIKLYGPFGISVGKLYANKNFYIMNNNLESITFTGTPTASNLQKIINLPLDFDDIVYLLRSDLPNNTPNNIFKLVKIEPEGELYFRKNNNSGEFALVDSLGKIINFQRKDYENNIILSAKYSDFIKISNTNFAKKIFINFPMYSGSATIEYTDIKISSAEDNAPLIFTKPQSYKLIELD